jgi:hypothetical protein
MNRQRQRLYFSGYAAELRASPDPYLKSFLAGRVPALVP